jgi:hypothetical protein
LMMAKSPSMRRQLEVWKRRPQTYRRAQHLALDAMTERASAWPR